jgi:hypothetical protein
MMIVMMMTASNMMMILMGMMMMMMMMMIMMMMLKMIMMMVMAYVCTQSCTVELSFIPRTYERGDREENEEVRPHGKCTEACGVITRGRFGNASFYSTAACFYCCKCGSSLYWR